jgi:hypothetical protein
MQPRFDVPRTFDDLERLFENLYSWEGKIKESS